MKIYAIYCRFFACIVCTLFLFATNASSQEFAPVCGTAGMLAGQVYEENSAVSKLPLVRNELLLPSYIQTKPVNSKILIGAGRLRENRFIFNITSINLQS